jgi:Ni,Fe-hydrogenase I large subunit
MARGIEAWLLSEYLSTAFEGLMDLIRRGDTRTFNAEHWDPKTWPKRCEGAGRVEAPRGSLGHRVVIRDQKIATYRILSPSTWNAGEGGANGPPGPYEAALVGTPILNPEEPVEILRTVHSFDPCLACACHVRDASGREVAAVRAP